MTEQNDLLTQLKTIPLNTVVVVPVKYLRPSEYNPRVIFDAEFLALKKSLKANWDFFFARPILVNAAEGREGVVIGGDKRLKAAIELGNDKVPVMFVKAESIQKEKAWNILDNKNAGAWDQEKLHDVIIDLHSSGFDMDSLGHTPDEITDLLEGISSSGGDEGAGSIPAGKGELCCPECGYTGVKKDFKKPETPA